MNTGFFSSLFRKNNSCTPRELRSFFLSSFLFLFIHLFLTDGSPITNPLFENGDVSKVIPDYFDTKHRSKAYHNNTPLELTSVPEIRFDKDDVSCRVEFRVKWSASVGSSVYAPPSIFPAGPDGKKQIFLSTFYQYIEVLGYDGFKPWGWPLSFEGSSFHGSPILYDIDGDGKNDIGVVDKNANLFFLRIGEFGQYLEDYHTQIPKLKVKRDWAANIDPSFSDSFVMLSMFDRKNKDQTDTLGGGDGEASSTSAETTGKKTPRAKPDAFDMLPIKQESYPELPKKQQEGRRRLLEEEEHEPRPAAHILEAETNPPLTDSEHLNQQGGEKISLEEKEHHQLEGGGEGGGEMASPDLGEEGGFPYARGVDDYVGQRNYYAPSYRGGYRSMDDGYHYYMSGFSNDSNFVFVDPHVLGSPALADVNGDGHMEVIMAVSYYFDKTEYSDKENLDFDPSLYVAGGVACWDLQSQDWSWMVHLDLTTDKTNFKALIHSSPTVADLDGDGRSEVLIGTSLGLLYLLDGETGFVRRFFPMQFHEIQAQVAVADVHGDSNLEIIVADMGGNLVLVDVEGNILWDMKLSGKLPHTPTIGDVNGDGVLDIVVVAVTKNGDHLWAIDGSKGVPLDGYPIALPRGGMVSSSVLLVDLHDYSDTNVLNPARYTDPSLPAWMINSQGHEPAQAPVQHLDGIGSGGEGKEKSKGLHLVVPSFDGHLYVIDGMKRCAERVDTGEHIYSMPLADDITGDGTLDIIIGTMNGQVIVLDTNVPYHALNAWPSFPKHRLNGFTHGHMGISVPEIERRALRHADIKGNQNLSVTFDIWDARKGDVPNRKFSVYFTRGTNKLTPILKVEYSQPGRYTAQLPMAPPEFTTLVVSMFNEHGQYFEDAVPVAVSTRFYVWLKYMAALPAFVLCIPLLLMKKAK